MQRALLRRHVDPSSGDIFISCISIDLAALHSPKMAAHPLKLRGVTLLNEFPQVKLRIDFHCIRLIVIKVKALYVTRNVTLKMVQFVIDL